MKWTPTALQGVGRAGQRDSAALGTLSSSAPDFEDHWDPQHLERIWNISTVHSRLQGYLAHEKTLTPLGTP